jgi:hypothetical protein
MGRAAGRERKIHHKATKPQSHKDHKEKAGMMISYSAFRLAANGRRTLPYCSG